MENNFEIFLKDENVTLPAKEINLNRNPNYCLILGHGLGTNGPKKRDHSHDKWITMIWNNLKDEERIGMIAYTARGHGKSTGWEYQHQDQQEQQEQQDNHSKNRLITQFTWESLSNDMISVSNSLLIPSFIAGGQSMGSATALYTAIKYNNRVSALILVRPPTAWEERLARRDHLEEVANQYQQQHPNDLHHNIFRGAAISDLPPINSSLYSLITCPVLILCHDGDLAHPISTGQILSTLLLNCQLIITETHEEALIQWPQIIKQFIYNLPPIILHSSDISTSSSSI